MSIVGFNLTKINAERKQSVVGNINISNNLSIKDVREANIGIAGDRGALRIGFAFMIDYTPNFATVLLEGEVLVLVDAKQSAAIRSDWDKNKTLPPQLASNVMNHILDRCNIQSLLISKDLNLPSPVPLPKVQINTPQGAGVAKPAEIKKDEIKTTKAKKKQ